MNLSVAQDNKNYFRITNPLQNKNITSFVIPFNCPLNMAFVGRHVPGDLRGLPLLKIHTLAKPR